ncbi:diheme cytochrome c [Zoogloea dura]|uniref:Cytochrome C n=1 Tax=Zoogloea dura TaxID=2728840 RepID=A0A848G7Q2_9RHOO|nr:diheme cytochrome c [Zoogloea dura]NML27310.1 cytochrome C [Zoogloea dura]
MPPIEHTHPVPALAGLLLTITLGLAGPAAADDDGRSMPRQVPKAYTSECGSCHLAFPPGALPAASWKHIMAGLDKHYGSNASLDDATTRQLDSWLQAHAGTWKRVGETPAQDRITRSAWFQRKHRQVRDAVWAHNSVKSPANCGACHPGAERGDFDDDHLKIPPGLPLHLRWAWFD